MFEGSLSAVGKQFLTFAHISALNRSTVVLNESALYQDKEKEQLCRALLL